MASGAETHAETPVGVIRRFQRMLERASMANESVLSVCTWMKKFHFSWEVKQLGVSVLIQLAADPSLFKDAHIGSVLDLEGVDWYLLQLVWGLVPDTHESKKLVVDELRVVQENKKATNCFDNKGARACWLWSTAMEALPEYPSLEKKTLKCLRTFVGGWTNVRNELASRQRYMGIIALAMKGDNALLALQVFHSALGKNPRQIENFKKWGAVDGVLQAMQANPAHREVQTVGVNILVDLPDVQGVNKRVVTDLVLRAPQTCPELCSKCVRVLYVFFQEGEFPAFAPPCKDRSCILTPL